MVNIFNSIMKLAAIVEHVHPNLKRRTYFMQIMEFWKYGIMHPFKAIKMILCDFFQ